MPPEYAISSLFIKRSFAPAVRPRPERCPSRNVPVRSDRAAAEDRAPPSMAAIFGPRANLVTNAVLLGLAGLALFAAFLIWGVPRMHYNTQVSLIPTQPVPFSHKHHVSELGIDCRYCHTSVEVSSNAGLPA